MTSTCTFYHIFFTQKRKCNDEQTHICTRCMTPVFLKTKKNKEGRCYTFSNNHRCNNKESSLTLSDTHEGLHGDHKAEVRVRRMHGSMPRASIVGLFCLSSVCVCGPHSVQRDSEVRDRICCATVCLPCQRQYLAVGSSFQGRPLET
jgi:hypothetical protein